MIVTWEILGIIAGLVTVSGYIPQIIKGYKTKRLEDLSYFLNVLIGLGEFMWTIYGFVINSLAVITTSSLCVILNLKLILMKYSYSKKKK